MRQFPCECGNLLDIDGLEAGHVGELMWDDEREGLEVELEREAAPLVEAIRGSTHAQWAAQNLPPGYPGDASAAEVMVDWLTARGEGKGRRVFACPTCSRLHLEERPGSKTFATFTPAGG